MNHKHFFTLLLIFGLLLVTACASETQSAADSPVNSNSIQGDEQMDDQMNENMVDQEDEHLDDHEDDDSDDHADGEEDEHMDDHEEEAMADHMHIDPPEEFASLQNPFAGDHDAIDAGEALFLVNCVTCHGTEGKGDGPAGEELDPKPANLADQDMMSMVSDSYIFWRITKGGAMEPFNSAMPTWEQVFTEEERWQLVSYVRTLGDVDHDAG